MRPAARHPFSARLSPRRRPGVKKPLFVRRGAIIGPAKSRAEILQRLRDLLRLLQIGGKLSIVVQRQVCREFA